MKNPKVTKEKFNKEDVVKYMKELQQGDYTHLALLKKECEDQVEARSIKHNFQEFTHWEREDLKSEIVGRMWHECQNYDEIRGTFSTWISNLTDTNYKKEYNKRKYQLKDCSLIKQGMDGEEYNLLEEMDSNYYTEEVAVKNDMWNKVKKALDMLPENHKKSIELCILKEMQPEEAANILKCSLNNVYTWKCRGLDKLRKILKEEDVTYDDFYMDRAS